MSAQAPAPTRVDRMLGAIERAGNRLPEPFVLFSILFTIVAVVSTAMALGDVRVQIPGADDATQVRGLFTSEGMVWLSTNLVPNFIEFPPLGTVLSILLGVGIAERSGLLAAAIRRAFGSAPRWALPYAVGFVGISGSIMSDSAFVVIPPLAAMVFAAAGRHPVAGLLGGFGAVGAGYSTSVFVTSLDALFAGITTTVTQSLPDPGTPVTAVSNYFFNVVSAVVLSLVAGFVIDRVLEPRLTRIGVPTEQQASEDGEEHPMDAIGEAHLTDVERRALRWAGLTMLLVAVAIVAAVLPSASPWRGDGGSFIPESPLLDSIVFVVFVLFAIPGLVYGFASGTWTSSADVPRSLAA
ncbi:AbgT family transporter, partial [Solicola sp. PLA-1-18]|uniref:AbgT family transporter n=1 Tax=Solicola sp. PLA-1-18 TaxID=3380532 RepID=UPI003B7E436D